MKTYKLELENIGEETYALMSRGHHDLSLFDSTVKEEYETWYSTLGKPEHLYFKAIPGPSGYVCLYVQSSKETRGSFPATYITEGSK